VVLYAGRLEFSRACCGQIMCSAYCGGGVPCNKGALATFGDELLLATCVIKVRVGTAGRVFGVRKIRKCLSHFSLGRPGHL
jgi:hypothetical protein